MKKNSLIFIFICLTFASFAQLSSGTIQLDGAAQVGVYRYEGTDINGTTINLLPSFTYFVNKHIAVSSQFIFEQQSGQNNNSFFYNTKGLSPSLFYFVNPDAKWKGYLRANYGFRTSKVNITGNPDDGWRANSSSIALGLGAVHFLKPSIALNAELYYGYFTTKFDVTSGNPNEITDKGFTFAIRLQNFLSPTTRSEISEGLLKKGRMVADGSLILSQLSNYSSFYTLNFSGEYGFMVANNFLIGSGIRVLAVDKESLTTISPYLSYYVPLNNRLSMFGQIGLQASFGEEDEYPIPILNGLGVNYFLSQNVALETKLSADGIYLEKLSGYSKGVSLSANLKYFIK